MSVRRLYCPYKHISAIVFYTDFPFDNPHLNVLTEPLDFCCQPAVQQERLPVSLEYSDVLREIVLTLLGGKNETPRLKDSPANNTGRDPPVSVSLFVVVGQWSGRASSFMFCA